MKTFTDKTAHPTSMLKIGAVKTDPVLIKCKFYVKLVVLIR